MKAEFVRNETRRKKQTTLSTRFEPRFWMDADGRMSAIREMRRRILRLQEESQADSYAREVLCERAVFVACQLETQEMNAVHGQQFDAGKYTQMVNALVGLLRSVGLERSAKKVASLHDYVESKQKRTKKKRMKGTL